LIQWFTLIFFMSEVSQSSESEVQSELSSASDPDKKQLGPWRCFLGAIVAGVIAIALYRMTSFIAHTFAAKPIHSNNYIVHRIAAAVRTLVIGMSALGTGVFGFASLGLFGLGIQLGVQRLKGQPTPPTS
jgi:hypothetical protein